MKIISYSRREVYFSEDIYKKLPDYHLRKVLSEMNIFSLLSRLPNLLLRKKKQSGKIISVCPKSRGESTILWQLGGGATAINI